MILVANKADLDTDRVVSSSATIVLFVGSIHETFSFSVCDCLQVTKLEGEELSQQYKVSWPV